MKLSQSYKNALIVAIILQKNAFSRFLTQPGAYHVKSYLKGKLGLITILFKDAITFKDNTNREQDALGFYPIVGPIVYLNKVECRGLFS